MRIAIAGDHHGVGMKALLTGWLTARGHEVDDHGAHGLGEGVVVDYPPLCVAVCRQVVHGRAERGIVIGGSGQGEAIACNKVHGIRAGLCQDLWSTQISRGNNDSNVLVLAAKILTPALAEEIVAAWLDTPFKGGVHRARLDQIAALERGAPWEERGSRG